MNLEFTGERFLYTDTRDQIAVEHIHRYQLAALLSKNLCVLDIGCGSGYGSQILGNAHSYLGVDISDEAIEECRQKFDAPNVSFRVADATDFDFGDQEFDLITCFEVLEHVEHPEDIILQAKRLLSANGIFVSSTPDKETYNSVLFEPNAFHVHEMTKSEYLNMLNSCFQHNRLFGQNFVQSSFIYDPNSRTNEWTEFSENTEAAVNQALLPNYWIALSSNSVLPNFDGQSLHRSTFSRNLGGELIHMMKQARIFYDQLQELETNRLDTLILPRLNRLPWRKKRL